MKTHEVISFQVEGRFPFPLDMLRYDQCWPATAEDVALIQETIARKPMSDRQTYRINLNCATRNGRLRVTSARWSSFGWSVVKEGYES